MAGYRGGVGDLVAIMDDLGTSGFLLQAIVAFGGGIVSFVSPCVLPLLPGYLAMMSGYSAADVSSGAAPTRLMFGKVALFVTGFTLVFAALGATASSLSQVLRQNLPELTRIAGAVIVVAGIVIVVMAFTSRGPFALLSREARLDVRPSRLGRWTAPVMGMAFAFGWTPCIGPILTVVLATAATQDTLARGVGLLVAYALGLGVPFLLAGLGLARVFSGFKRWMRPINIASGVALAAFGVVMLTGTLSTWSSGLSRFFIDVPVLEQLANI